MGGLDWLLYGVVFLVLFPGILFLFSSSLNSVRTIGEMATAAM
ncbi:hypothetical protein RAS1_15690 [Phycisphaerae bacterium RAS1]|nr:hypothetical protein RAS1_15690 [Phycisphaerae bacterium RAS1]